LFGACAPAAAVATPLKAARQAGACILVASMAGPPEAVAGAVVRTRTLPPMSRSALALLASALVTAAAAPLAAQTTWFGANARAGFTAAAITPVTNDLNTNTPVYDFGALGTATASGNGIATINGALFGSGGGTPTPAWTLSFSQAIGAFGADFTGLGTINTDFPYPAGEARFTFYNGATTVGTVAQNFGLSGVTAFFGVTGLAAFDRVEIRTNVGDEFWTDDVTLGALATTPPPVTTTPEPATLALVGAGALALGGVARRRRPTA
jgi:hypothetical protein